MRWSTRDSIATAGAGDGEGSDGSPLARYLRRLRIERSPPTTLPPADGGRVGWGTAFLQSRADARLHDGRWLHDRRRQAADVLPNGQAAPPVIEIPARLVETDDVAR